MSRPAPPPDGAARRRSLLPDLRLLAPPLGPTAAAPAREPANGPRETEPTERRSDQPPAAEPLPAPEASGGASLLWLDPPWGRVPPETAARSAAAVTAEGVGVSWLGADLGGAEVAGPRLCPYRPERFGLALRDLRSATWVNVVLQPAAAGRTPPRWPIEALRRYAARSHRLPAEPTLDARRWPADVPTVGHLAKKVAQLRELAGPDVKVWITIGPDRLADDLPLVLEAGADGVVLRAEGRVGEPLRAGVRASRAQIATASAGRTVTLAVSAGVSEPADAVKLMALGADFVAIDAVLEGPLQSAPSPSPAPAWLAPAAAEPPSDFAAGKVAAAVRAFCREVDAWRSYCGAASLRELREADVYEVDRSR